MSEKEVLWSQEGPVVVLTLNRPAEKNALSATLVRQLHESLQRAADDDTVRAIVLTGAGDAFSAGYDLALEDDGTGSDRVRDVLKRWWNSSFASENKFLAVMRLEKPVIAAVNGWCLGGGFWYALSCDITIASDRAVFGQPEIREVQNSTFLFAALAGWKHAHRYTLTGDHFDAREAERIGVVNEVVPHDQLMERTMALAQRIALVPPDSVRLNKMITVLGLEAMGLRTGLTTAGLTSVIIHSSRDAAELDELRHIRDTKGLGASLKFRDGPFLPEPGGPRSRRPEQ